MKTWDMKNTLGQTYAQWDIDKVTINSDINGITLSRITDMNDINIMNLWKKVSVCLQMTGSKVRLRRCQNFLNKSVI